MKRYIISEKQVRNERTGIVLGRIVRYSDGTSAFIACKRVIAGNCVNLGLRW